MLGLGNVQPEVCLTVLYVAVVAVWRHAEPKEEELLLATCACELCILPIHCVIQLQLVAHEVPLTPSTRHRVFFPSLSVVQLIQQCWHSAPGASTIWQWPFGHAPCAIGQQTISHSFLSHVGMLLQGLAQYGNGFLAKFEAASCANKLLEEVTLVDTPGVLSGEKQRIERTYNFIDVCGWFAARCDLILLLFDPHKLDISDEFKQVRCCQLVLPLLLSAPGSTLLHGTANRWQFLEKDYASCMHLSSAASV